MTLDSDTPETDSPLEALEDLVISIVEAVVDKEDSVVVSFEQRERSVTVMLETARSDVGLVIGQSGRVITGIRSILDAFGGKNQMRVDLDFVTEEDAPKRRPRPARRVPKR